jgi:hypothetical protein
MNQNNLFLLEDEVEFFNEKNKTQNIANDVHPCLFLLDGVNFQSFDKFNQPISENITLEHIKNIMNTPKIDLLEEEEKDSMDDVYLIKEQNNSKLELQSTDSSTKTVTFSQSENSAKKEDIFLKKINFKTMLYRKRGRKEKNNTSKKMKKKCHGPGDFDNIQRKIQVHFITFLIKFANDAIKTILGNKVKYHFRDIKYDIKKIVNHDYVEYLKNVNYSDILQMVISPKNKKYDENSNKKLYKKLIEESDLFKKMFDKKYLYILQKYYLELKGNESETDFDGIKIKLSNKTKPFPHLLQKNESEKDKFNNIVKDVYFSDVNYLIEKKFVTKQFIINK